MDSYFTTYRSNTSGGFSNQSRCAVKEARTGRIFYRITCGGTYRYSLLFADSTDSTFRQSTPNCTVGNWHIHAAAVARVGGDFFESDFQSDSAANRPVTDFVSLTFHGATEKAVAKGERFACDPLTLTFADGDYLCLELTVSGDSLPCHPECVLPMYEKQPDGRFTYGREFPAAVMVGCDRPVLSQIGFFGDSITQGIGPAYNSYQHWSALLADKIGNQHAYWNLGIGCGRAADAVTNGAWMAKARHCDTVFVCFGVNDLGAGYTANEIIASLNTIVQTLKADGKTVVLQTVPPFDYQGARIETWQTVNTYLQNILSKQVDVFFDCVPVLCGDQPQTARYGGHPDEEGSRLWANALYTTLSQTEVSL